MKAAKSYGVISTGLAKSERFKVLAVFENEGQWSCYPALVIGPEPSVAVL